jgi:hypothetical protein
LLDGFRELMTRMFRKALHGLGSSRTIMGVCRWTFEARARGLTPMPKVSFLFVFLSRGSW